MAFAQVRLGSNIQLLPYPLVTLPRPSSAVRCRPSMQIDGSCSSADVAAERHKSEQLAVNLAVNQPLHCEDAAAAV
jgi:hypothetical protein